MRARGFTLVELAVVIAIVGLLLSTMLYTLSAQTEQRNFADTRLRLEQARDALLSFSINRGRLPCPARYTSDSDHTFGRESFCTGEAPAACGAETQTEQAHGTCFTPFGGFVPAATLGLGNVDTQGFAVDAWGNRLRYAVSRQSAPGQCAVTPPDILTPLYTSKNNLKTYGIACQPNDLIVCRSATGITSTDCGTANNALMTPSTVIAIVFSTGKNGALGTPSTDEQANLNADRVFLWHTPTPDFDDQMLWITPGELYGRLISAGVLP